MGYKNLNLPEADNEELPEGLILISGKNSHGKSTIIEGILFAFFFGIRKGEQIFKGRTAESYINYEAKEKAEIYVYFVLDNTNYYIYRKWGKSGSISVKLFEMDKKGTYRECTDFDIEEFLEISKDQAMSTIFIKQGEVEKLATMSGADLRDMIIDLFRLNIIDDALDFLDKDKKAKEEEQSLLKKSRVPIDRINEDITRIEQQNETYQRTASKKEEHKIDIEKEINSLPAKNIISEIEHVYKEKEISDKRSISYKSDFEKKIKSTDLKLDDFSSIERILKNINGLNASKTSLQNEKDDLEKKKGATTKGKGIIEGKIQDLMNKIVKMQNSLKFTEKKGGIEIARCPTCQNELTKEHYDNLIQEFSKELEVNQSKLESVSQVIKRHEDDLKAKQKELENIIKSITIIQNLKDDFENYQNYTRESKKLKSDLDVLLIKNKDKIKDASLEGIQKIALDLEKLTLENNTIVKEIEDKMEEIKQNQARIKELNQEIERMKDIEKKIGEYEVDIDHISKTKEYVRRFVTEYMLTKRLVKDITIITDKYIRDFTSGQYSDLLLDTSSTKKTGLALKIKDNFNGQREPVEILSGGDRTALGIALRLAISELMGHIRPTKDSPKRNPKINFLMLDEPLAALDEVRRERILKYLTRSKTFSQIFLITHTEIPFDVQTHKILVEKDTNTGVSSARFERLHINS